LHSLTNIRVGRNNQHTHAKQHNENQSSIVIPIGFSPYGGSCTVHDRGSHEEQRTLCHTSRYQTENKDIENTLPNVLSVNHQLKLSKEVTFVGSTRLMIVYRAKEFLFTVTQRKGTFTAHFIIESNKQNNRLMMLCFEYQDWIATATTRSPRSLLPEHS